MARALQLVGRPTFTTSELAAIRGASVAATTQALRRLQQQEVLQHVTRGVWAVPADPRFTAYALVSLLAAGHWAYVSFLSALRLHAMIEQIPQQIYVATTGPSRTIETPVGSFSFHRIDPRFFAGFEWYRNSGQFLVAEPEKALVDCLYVSSRRGKRFRHLPGLELGTAFDRRRAQMWVQKIPDARIASYVEQHLAHSVPGT